jgi:hypothetical protein
LIAAKRVLRSIQNHTISLTFLTSFLTHPHQQEHWVNDPQMHYKNFIINHHKIVLGFCHTSNTVTSATPHVRNQNSLVVQMMFISSHEIEHSFSNKAQRLVYRRLRRRTKRRLRDTRSVADSNLVHSSTLIPPHFSEPFTIVKITHFSATYIFVNYCTYLHDDDAI